MLKLETIQEKPWHLQLAAFGVVALLLYGGFWYFLTSGTREETKQIEENVARLQSENARAQIASQRLNEFRLSYARTQADYDDLKALLPEQRELTTVLQGVQDQAARGRLSVRSFKPKDDIQQDFYSGKPIEIAVSGTYNDIGRFFAQMAAYQRIVSITDFKLGSLNVLGLPAEFMQGRTVGVKFLLTAYYVSAEKLHTTAPAQPPAAGATPAPAAPPVAVKPPSALPPQQGQGQ